VKALPKLTQQNTKQISGLKPDMLVCNCKKCKHNSIVTCIINKKCECCDQDDMFSALTHFEG